MNALCDTAAKFIGDTARPASIYILAGGLVAGAMSGIGEGALSVLGLAFGGAIGARAFENHAQIKADAEVKKAEVSK